MPLSGSGSWPGPIPSAGKICRVARVSCEDRTAQSDLRTSAWLLVRELERMSRVAVVTGANKGVGYYIAQQLVQSREFGVVVLGCRSAPEVEVFAAHPPPPVTADSAV